jgi:hypothetical protein
MYVEILRRLIAGRWKRSENWHETTGFCSTATHLDKCNVTALEHRPYSPDLTPPDFFLFPLRKSVLKGQRFSIVEEVTAKMSRALT